MWIWCLQPLLKRDGLNAILGYCDIIDWDVESGEYSESEMNKGGK